MMHKLKLLTLLCLGLTFHFSAQSQRVPVPTTPPTENPTPGLNGGTICDLCATGANFEWIKGVTINGSSGVMNFPGSSAGGCYNSLSLDAYFAVMKIGQYQRFTLTPGFSGTSQSEYWKIWIDVNRDGDLDDPADLVYASTSGSNTTVQDSFLIPANLFEGPAVMRVAMRRGSPPGTCGDYPNGQVATFTSVYLDKCNISFTNACAREYIQQVKINAINHVSDCGASGYQDFTNFSTTLQRDSTYQLNLTPGFVNATQHPERWLVWIDYNHDYDFDDPGEKAFDSGAVGSAAPVSGTIHIPTNAVKTTTLMRVKMIPTDVSTVTTDPCDPVGVWFPPDEFGEAEDYTIFIKGKTLSVQSGIAPETLVGNILVGGECLDVSNVSVSGDLSQLGQFSNGLSNIGFDKGVILATGDIQIAPGPNDMNGAGGGGAGGSDDDLSSFATGNLFDISALEFDFTPTQSSFTLEFVFASEEYCEYVNTQFSDVFGIFISGPGISGTQNLAVTPATNTPVSINTINHVTNSGLYVHNTPVGFENCETGGVSGNLPPVPPATGPGPEELQYDGFTKKLVAAATVIPCSTYHLKIAIADVGDGVWDSAVFLKAGSLSGGGKASLQWLVDGQPAMDATEGCGTVQVLANRLGSNTSLPLPVTFSISGTASAGSDFSNIPFNVIIPAGQDQVLLPVNILNDLIPESAETIVLTLNNACSCLNPQEVLTIHDYQPMVASPDTVLICGPTGAATIGVTVEGGVEPYSYQWVNGMTDASITVVVSNPSNFTVTITDACGQTKTAVARVQLTMAPNAFFTPPAPQICPNGSAIIMVNFNGMAPFDLSYSYNGTVQPTITGITQDPYALVVNTPGLYQGASVVDSLGCPGPGLGALAVTLSNLTLSGTSTNPGCNAPNSGSISLLPTGGQSPYQYAWQGPTPIGNLPNPTDLAQGNYVVTLTDAIGCSIIQDYTISPPAAISLSVSGACNALTVNASGGSGTFQYSLDGVQYQADNQFSNLQNGVYTVWVSDAGGCTATAQATVNNMLNLSTQLLHPNCFGDQNGKITVSTTGGLAPYTYSLNGGPGQGSNVFDMLLAGSYSLTVVDNNGCSANTALVLSDPAPLQIAATVIQFTIVAQASGGTGALSYSINGVDFQPDNQFFDVPNGNYILSVRDANGCSASTEAVVNVFTASAQASEILCFGGSGRLTVTPNGGTPPYQYQLDNGAFQSGNVFDNLPAGTYLIAVQDASNNLLNLAPIILSEPNPLQLAVYVDCNDATINVVGGTFPYQSDPPESSLKNLSNGTYQVVITDDHGCTTTEAFEVDIAPLGFSIEVDSVLCFGDNSGSITALGQGGCPPYQYSLIGSPFFINGNFNNLSSGPYSITVKDSQDSLYTLFIAVPQPAQLSLTATVDGTTITASASGGVLPYTYHLDPGPSQQTPVFSDLASGTYTLKVTDGNGCLASAGNLMVTVGTTDLAESWGLRVSPNPGSGLFRLTMEHAPEVMLAQVFDLSGRRIKSVELNPENGKLITSLDLQVFPNGTYLLLLGDGQKWGSLYLSKTGD